MSYIKIKLKRNNIDADRYEEFIWLNSVQYSVFKDGLRDFKVVIGNTTNEKPFTTKRAALDYLTSEFIKNLKRV